MLSERFHYDLASLLRQIGVEAIAALHALQYVPRRNQRENTIALSRIEP